jgi:4-hydroxybenzoate polyprenyltransferase
LNSVRKTLEDDEKKKAQTQKITFGKNVRKYLLLLGTLGGMLRMSFLSNLYERVLVVFTASNLVNVFTSLSIFLH